MTRVRRGLTDERRLFLRLCLRLDYVDIEPVMSHARHLQEQHEGSGPVDPSDLLFYLRITTTGKQHFVDELCRLLYVMGRHDLVAKYVAPFDGGILSLPEACARVRHFRSADEQLLQRLAEMTPRMFVKIIARSSALSRERQREVLQQPLTGARLLMNFLRQHQPGFMHCLWDWFVELDLAAPMKVMEEYVVSSTAWPRGSAALSRHSPLSLFTNCPPAAKRAYRSDGDFANSSAPPLLSNTDDSPDTPAAGLPIATVAACTQSHSPVSQRRNEDQQPSAIPSGSFRHVEGTSGSALSMAAGTASPTSIRAAAPTTAGSISPESSAGQAKLQTAPTVNRVAPPSVLGGGGQSSSAATRILSKLSQSRPSTGSDSADTEASSPTTPTAKYPSVLKPSSADSPGTTSTAQSGPITGSSVAPVLGGTVLTHNYPSARSPALLQTRQSFDRISDGNLVPVLTPAASMAPASTGLAATSPTQPSVLAPKTLTGAPAALSPASAKRLQNSTSSLSPPTSRQLRAAASGNAQRAAHSSPQSIRKQPEVVTMEPDAKRAAAAGPGNAGKAAGGDATKQTESSHAAATMPDLPPPTAADMLGLSRQQQTTAAVSTAQQRPAGAPSSLYPNLEELVSESSQKPLAPYLADHRTFSTEAPEDRSSDSSPEPESESSDEDMYYSARDSPGAMTDGGASSRAKPPGKKQPALRKNPKRASRKTLPKK